jgi:pilus assembly protein CpaB
MDVRRIAIALLVALVVSAGATYAVYSRIRNQRSSQPSTTKVVAANAALQAGAALSAENLTLIDWPVSVPLTGSFVKPDDIVGRSLIYPISPKQPILERDLAVAGSGIGLTVKIPEGMRATAVRSNEIVGVAGFLYPGSHVDVLLTFRPEGAPATITQTILQNVEVLTAGQKIQPDPQGKAETVNVVTLLLTPQDSQKIVLASQQGSIQFVLRNGADSNDAPTKPVSMSELMASPKKDKDVAQPHLRAAKLAKPKQPEFYVVETIAGDKRTVEKF